MKTVRTSILIAAALAAGLVGIAPQQASAVMPPNMWPLRRAWYYNWNRNYAHVEYGQPVAMVVPPTAQLQTNWNWGVGSSRISRIDHQFGRNYPGYGQFGGPFFNTPVWPSDTNQFGVYYIRGPW